MQIAGLVKNSFVDYPGYIAATLFVPGCNMDCFYCHNKHIWHTNELLPEKEIFDFLDSHIGFLDGVVITGGEPTLQRDLLQFIKRVRLLGYKIKLDTNGLLPQILEKLIKDLDYIAMDIKAPLGEYSKIQSMKIKEENIKKSIDLITLSGVDYEFRTTFAPQLSVFDIEKIAIQLMGAKRYAIQQYRRENENKIALAPHSKEIVEQAAEGARKHLVNVIMRGL
ncbi:MAG: anaerobic ribonucleoside-triphosphate reductase activating protein [Clostridiales bacterium]|nr:anaerobic ribonucleoside-triphosphate reductase activating protein [Clostridiales bacterium]